MKRYLIICCLFLLSAGAFGQTAQKALQQTSLIKNPSATQFSLSNSDWILNDTVYADDYALDLLKPQTGQRTYLEKQNNVYGQQVMFRMQFADWLSLRLGVYDVDQTNQLFMPLPSQNSTSH